VKFVVVILVVVIVFAGVALIVVVKRGLSSREQPTLTEEVIARAVRHLATPVSMRQARNPVPLTSDVLAEARAHWADHCATCHGNDGRGQTDIGRNLYPKPPDLRREQTQKLADGEIFWIIENGVRFTGMPAFGGAHGSEEDSWKLVRFIRHLPQLTAEERMEMERYNPKGPDDREEEQEENEFLGGKPMQQKHEGAHHH